MSNSLPAGQAVILASASPRRHDLLSLLLPSFDIAASPVEEQGDTRVPERPFSPVVLPAPFVLRETDDPRLWAWRKAMDVLERGAGQTGIPSLVLAADTVVLGPGEALGKPRDRAHALQMLSLLRGREHYVVTGYVLVRSDREGVAVLDSCAVCSHVSMRAFSQEELESYLDTGEPYDKAGAYALQGLGGRLVESVEGCRTNVIGLPLCAVREALAGARVSSLLAYPGEGYCTGCGATVSKVCEP